MSRISPTIPLRPDETPASLVSRLALRHQIPSVRIFALDMGFPFQSVVDGDPQTIRQVAELVGRPLGQIRDAAIRRTGVSFELRGQELLKGTLRRARVMICPQCIAEDLVEEASPWMASGRVNWLLDPIRSCRHHAVALIEVAKVDAPTLLHDFARCVAPSLPEIPRLAADAVVVPPSPLELYLLDRLDGSHHQAWLDALPWHAAARTCEVIGAVATFGRKAPVQTMTDDQWREAGNTGFEIAATGYGGIRTFLEELRSTYPESHVDPSGPQARFGRLHTWLTGSQTNGLDPSRDIMIDVVRDTAPVGPDERLFGRPIVERRRLHSIRTAALETRLHPKRLRRILAACGTIPPDHRGLTDDRVLFSAPEAETTLEKAKHAITEVEAQVYLNAGRVHTRLLVKAGLIVPFAAAGLESMKDNGFDTRDLDDFLARLTAKAEPLPTHAEPIYRIPEAAKRTNCTAAEIVRAILDDKMEWVGQVAGESGYMSVLVDLSEVRGLFRGEHGDNLPLAHVQSTLKTTFGVVEHLIPTGILPSREAISPLNRCPYIAVQKNDLSAFVETYGSLHELARERGTHFLPFKKALMARGIEPAFGKPVIPATFYRRADIPPDL
jgi:hypothetical protein